MFKAIKARTIRQPLFETFTRANHITARRTRTLSSQPANLIPYSFTNPNTSLKYFRDVAAPMKVLSRARNDIRNEYTSVSLQNMTNKTECLDAVRKVEYKIDNGLRDIDSQLAKMKTEMRADMKEALLHHQERMDLRIKSRDELAEINRKGRRAVLFVCVFGAVVLWAENRHYNRTGVRGW